MMSLIFALIVAILNLQGYSDADKIVKAIWLHYVYFIPHAKLEQLKRGLCETLQIEILMCLHPEEMHSFLVALI